MEKFFLQYIHIDASSIVMLVIVVVGIFIAWSCKREETGEEYKNISGEELSALIALKTNLTILDVRSKYEYENSHIPNAINISVDEIHEVIETKIPNKTELIVIYCESGLRAKMALKIMKKMGYKKIYNLGSIDKYFF